jgi:hypothetical protein
MKYLILLAFIVSSCNENIKKPIKDVNEKSPQETKGKYSIYIQIIDSCEYIIVDKEYLREGSISITHKANCKNHLK